MGAGGQPHFVRDISSGGDVAQAVEIVVLVRGPQIGAIEGDLAECQLHHLLIFALRCGLAGKSRRAEVRRKCEVHLSAGDVVVQRGTRHAWHNRGTEPCKVAFILIGSSNYR